jgi:hypothetical protein
MTSRWAYEALAVDQFKDNKYTRNFFAEDMIKSNAAYDEFVLDQIKVILNNSYYEFKKDSAFDLSNSFRMIKAELSNLTNRGVIDPFTDLDKLIPLQFNDQVYRTVLNYLAREKKKIALVKRGAMENRDSIYNNLMEDLGGEDNYLRFKDEHVNDKLEELLTTKYSESIIVDNRFVRKKNLIYMPPDSRFGRAHFYAPVKKLGSLTIDTYLFNFLFIWVTSFLCYLALVFDVLRRLVNWGEKIKFRKKLRSGA